jgi:putative addiction module component (TIGR02574 family)
MTTSAEITTRAMRLSPRERAKLASRLIASLDAPPDPHAEETWAAEIDCRLDNLDESKLIDWRDAIGNARKSLRKKKRK